MEEVIKRWIYNKKKEKKKRDVQELVIFSRIIDKKYWFAALPKSGKTWFYNLTICRKRLFSIFIKHPLAAFEVNNLSKTNPFYSFPKDCPLEGEALVTIWRSYSRISFSWIFKTRKNYKIPARRTLFYPSISRFSRKIIY